MAIQVTSTVKQSTRVYKVGVTLTARAPIATPEYFVIHDPDTMAEVIAKAGLPSTTVFVAALLLNSGYVGSEYYYDLLITVDPLPPTATSHFHDSSTLNHPLREAYRDGPYIDLDPSLGPVDIFAIAPNTVDYLRVHLGPANFLFVRRDGTIQLGSHLEYTVDTTYDIGSIDGLTLRRPRDVYVGRDAWIARFGYFGTSAKSPEYRFFQSAANPDTSPLERHLYWNSTDNKPHVWNGTIDYPLDTCADCPGTFGIYDGTAVSTGDVVAMQGLTAVIPADASVPGQNPVIGVCIDKPSAAVALVQFSGEVSTFAPGSLIPGRRYFLAKVAGGVTDDVSSYSLGDAIQLLGVSKTDGVLTLALGPRTVL